MSIKDLSKMPTFLGPGLAGGGGGTPAAFSGALIHMGGAPVQSFTAGNNDLIYNSTHYDEGGWYDQAADPEVFVVPTGVNRVRLSATLTFGVQSTSATDQVVFKSRKNGGNNVIGGQVTQYISTTSAFFGVYSWNYVTAPIPCVPGDTFGMRCQVVLLAAPAAIAMSISNQNIFGIEAVPG